MQLVEQERSIISLDIHDGLIQEIVAAKMMVEAAHSSDQTDNAGLKAKLKIAEQQLGRAIAEARRLMNQFQPISLHEFGLLVTIEHLARQLKSEAELSIDCQFDGELADLPEVLENSLYRIVQESLNNIRKHAQAESVIVKLERRGNELWLSIEDDGCGFEPGTVQPENIGLRGIRQRAAMCHGRADIASKHDVGTTVTVVVPIPK
ncbi:MAG: signal transduction histidine kinase [Pirellulaceae bacterium]|jgi:signal transduction histidine kinase